MRGPSAAGRGMNLTLCSYRSKLKHLPLPVVGTVDAVHKEYAIATSLRYEMVLYSPIMSVCQAFSGKLSFRRKEVRRNERAERLLVLGAERWTVHRDVPLQMEAVVRE